MARRSYAKKVIAKSGLYAGPKHNSVLISDASGIPALHRQISGGVQSATNGSDVTAYIGLVPSVGPVKPLAIKAIVTSTVAAPDSGTSTVTLRYGSYQIGSKTFDKNAWYPSSGNVFTIEISSSVVSIPAGSALSVTVENAEGVSSPSMIVSFECVQFAGQ